MKYLNKILSFTLVLVMIFAMTTTVFAADVTTYSITINNRATEHSYEAYQIFTGDVSSKTITVDDAEKTVKVLANIEWADGVTYSGAGVTVDGIASTAAADLADALETGTLTLDVFLADLSLGNKDGSTNTHVNNEKYVISGLTPGYYLVKDEDGSQTGNQDAYTEYIIQVVGDAEANAKADVPEVEKKVTDVNDTTGTSTDLQDSADYDFGDNVPFQLKATLAENVSAYEKYKIVFHDTMSKGLKLNATIGSDNLVTAGVTVTKSGTNVTNAFTITAVTDNTTGSTKLTISCNDVKADPVNAGNKDEIIVTYTAKLTNDAQLGAAGNTNVVYLEYSNDPNVHYDGKYDPNDPDDPDNPDNPPPTGQTPEDKVIVFTYVLDIDKVHKVDNVNEPLTGAGFTLYKWLPDTTTEDTTDGSWNAVGEELTGESKTNFQWSGLDDGKYKLVETTTPVGYNTMKDIEFTITAKHTLVNASPVLESLTGSTEDDSISFTPDTTAGSLSADIVNKPGTVLPVTGGIGTTIFYILGAVLVLGAIVLLVTKKRMSRQA